MYASKKIKQDGDEYTITSRDSNLKYKKTK